MITKKQWRSAPKVENLGISTGVEMQDVRILSASEDRIKVIGAVPGLTGFSPDGSVRFEYSGIAMFNHEVEPGAIVDINHDLDAIVGQIRSTDVTPNDEVIVEFEFNERYKYLTPLVKNGDFDGVSIESKILAGHQVDDNLVIVTHFMLTGIAVLFGKPPACDKEICHVLSHDASATQSVKIYDIISQIEGMTDDEFKQSYSNVLKELESRTNDSTINGDS